MYALANSVWIVFAARALMGAGVSFGASAIHAYLGEMGTVMDDIREKQGKSPRKFLLYIGFSFTLNGGMVVPNGELCMTNVCILLYSYICWVTSCMGGLIRRGVCALTGYCSPDTPQVHVGGKLNIKWCTAYWHV